MQYCGSHTDLQYSKSSVPNHYCYLEHLWILEALYPPTARLTVQAMQGTSVFVGETPDSNKSSESFGME